MEDLEKSSLLMNSNQTTFYHNNSSGRGGNKCRPAPPVSAGRTRKVGLSRTQAFPLLCSTREECEDDTEQIHQTSGQLPRVVTDPTKQRTASDTHAGVMGDKKISQNSITPESKTNPTSNSAVTFKKLENRDFDAYQQRPSSFGFSQSSENTHRFSFHNKDKTILHNSSDNISLYESQILDSLTPKNLIEPINKEQIFSVGDTIKNTSFGSSIKTENCTIKQVTCENGVVQNHFSFVEPLLAGCSPKKSESIRETRKRKSTSMDPETGFFDNVRHLSNCSDDDLEDEEDEEKYLGIFGNSHCPSTPTSPKTARCEDINYDPYQCFEVNHTPCFIFTVRVIEARNVTNGWLQDCYDVPDPYICLVMKSSPDGKKKTSIAHNNANPVWNESFEFFVNIHTPQYNILEIQLMEHNSYSWDQKVGDPLFFSLSEMTEIGQHQRRTFRINEVTDIDFEFKLEEDRKPTLRYSLCLSDEEKRFMERRRQKVFNALGRLIESDSAPATLNEVPTIAVIGSGGGFRAMTAYSGVVKALRESGVLDTVTYMAGLSGSSWLLSTLYSDPKWPNLDMAEFQTEMKHNIDQCWLRKLTPVSVVKYLSYMRQKYKDGQPVSFTDVFGRLVGETLIGGRIDAKLTDQREKIDDGNIPMPLYTCVHVKKDVPARNFQEWVEFSPYEIGMPKYGTFLKSELFGSKFFMGKLVKKFDEQPLHFLQGIWGSAFSILFNRLLEDNSRIDPTEMIRQEMNEVLRDDAKQESIDSVDFDSDAPDDSDNTDDENDDESELDTAVAEIVSRDRLSNSSEKSADSGKSWQSEEESEEEQFYSFESEPDRDCVDRTIDNENKKKKSVTFSKFIPEKNCDDCHDTESASIVTKPRRPSTKNSSKNSFFQSYLKSIVHSNLDFIKTRQGRAAVIHNFMRGLSLQETYPISPFTPFNERVKEGEMFDEIFKMHPTCVKHVYMVDAGLTFNSPYPLILRPQRKVDIILSFDFTARLSDKDPPFKELLLAEQWAKLNRLPFPPIDKSVFEREGMKELYIFRDPNDLHCPVVLHFVLINDKFRKYKRPGVPRATKEEFEFADFDLFDDPAAPYSTFNFTYTHESFDRLSQLMEFNTLLHIDQIKEVIRDAIQVKKYGPPKLPVQSQDIKLLHMKSVQERRKLKRFISRMSRSSHSSVSTNSVSSFFTAGSHPSPVGEPSPFFHRALSVESSNSSNTGEHKLVTAKMSSSSSERDSVFGTPPDRVSLLQQSSKGSFETVEEVDDVNGDEGKSFCEQTSKNFNRSNSKPPVLEIETNNISDSNFSASSIGFGPLISGSDTGSTSFSNFQSDSGFESSSSYSSSISLDSSASAVNSLNSVDSSSGLSTKYQSKSSKKEALPNPFFLDFRKSRAKYAATLSQRKYKNGKTYNYKPSPLIEEEKLTHDEISNKRFKQCDSLPSRSIRNSQSDSLESTSSNIDSSTVIPAEDGEQLGPNGKLTLALEPSPSGGTSGTNYEETKMLNQEAKSKRLLFRRQSTVSSLNSISLEEGMINNQNETDIFYSFDNSNYD